MGDWAYIYANYAPAHKIVNKQQYQTRIKGKNESGPFLNLFLGDQNGHPEDDPRAYELAEVGAVIGKKREGETKREIKTQRELVMAQKSTHIMGRACL